VAKLPNPNRDSFTRRAGDLRRLKHKILLWRIYFGSGDYPTAWNALRFYGPCGGRFDHHPLGRPAMHNRHGIIYLAKDVLTCFAEVFQEHRSIDTRRNSPRLVSMRLTRTVTLLDLTGTWPTRNGASTAIHSGPRPRARMWARAIYETWPDVEGLLYGSSINAYRPAIALFERARAAIPTSPASDRALADPVLRKLVLRAGEEFNFPVL